MKLLNKIRWLFDNGTFSISDIFALFLTGFICANYYTAAAGSFTDLSYVRDINIIAFFIVFVCVELIMASTLIALKSAVIVNWALLCSSVAFAMLLCSQLNGQIYFNIGVAFVLFFIIKYLTEENRLGIDMLTMSNRMSFAVTAAVFAVFVILVSICTVMKYKTFSHSAFDFGIFCQMFEQMAETGLPFTTVERSEYLSHFAVHFSPVYYLLLPFYMIFRSPVFLLVAQAFIVGFGMFPLRRICMKLGMSPAISAAAAILYAVFPTMANGCFYDFHENKFLSVFILYMIYFVLCEKNVGIIIFALATLSVKEDAAIYVMAITIWMLLTKRKRITALIVFALSVIYFIFACKMIELSGGEIMMSRLENYYIEKDGGFIKVIKTCFFDIGFLIKEVFLGANTERFSELTYGGQKIEFIFWTCIPLLFMPFASRHTTHLVLMIPLLVINLMPEWMYQHNIDYQYTYGTVALLLVAAFLALSEKTPESRRKLVICMLAISMAFTTSAIYSKAGRYIARYNKDPLKYIATENALDTIPHDASVTAYGFFIPYLSYIDDLHTCPDYYGPYEKTDYYVIDTRYADDSHTAKMISAMEDDYTLVCEDGFAKIYKRTSNNE
ncbi:MAG: DUF2079 domain-containing protein [Clostridia bacterium]|nr:DUF2079 domain-containing protein [Clostridia bacterium]